MAVFPCVDHIVVITTVGMMWFCKPFAPTCQTSFLVCGYISCRLETP